MDDEEDVKKMMEVIQSCKEEDCVDIQYDEFIYYDESDAEENEETPDIEEEYLLGHLTNTNISSLTTHDPRSTLKSEERLVIDSCSDPELRELLLLNRTKNIQLMQLHKKIKDLLMECRKNIEEKGDIVKQHIISNKSKSHSTGAWRLAAPYFKDKQLYSYPPNSDVIRKRNNNELSIYDLSCSPRWSTVECEKLVRAVKLNYNISQQNAIVKQIQDITHNENLSDKPPKLKELEDRLQELRDNDDSEIPALNSDENIDWMRVSDVFLQDKHSAFECKSFWHIYLHPFINKSLWTPEEDTKLKELAEKNNFQNWDEIAKELETNRTGFTACLNYYKNLHNRFKKGEFTHEEDAKLLQLIDRYKMGDYIPWIKIVQHFKNRTRSQLHCRYSYYLIRNDYKKGKFTDAEDLFLMILVDKFGKNFKKCAEYLPSRSMVQCKSRYNSNLQGSIKKGSFTVEEDESIMKYVAEHGEKSWTNLTKLLCRNRGQLRQRYNTIKQFLFSDPDLPLSFVPKRKHHLKYDEESFQMLRTIADKYRGKPNIPNLQEIKIILKNYKEEQVLTDSEESEDCIPEIDVKTSTKDYMNNQETNVPQSLDIDNLLTNFFCNSFKINSTNNISSANLRTATHDVETILDVLKVDLDIPENFKDNAALDNLDKAILSDILEKKVNCPSVSHNNTDKAILLSVSPNLNTMVGLRSLLIKYSNYKSERETMLKFMNRQNQLGNQRHNGLSGIRADIIKHTISLPFAIREQVEMEYKLFFQRFYALFKWPGIMTLENPQADLEGSIQRCNKIARPVVTRTYSRSNKRIETPQVKQTNNRDNKASETSQVKRMCSAINSQNETNNSVAKRVKICEMPSTSSKALPLKLTPITNKSVIEGLIRDQSKKLFLFDQVKYAGETKTVIREVNISHIRNDASSAKVDNKKLTKAVDRTSCQASSSNEGKLFKLNTGRGECVILDSDSDDGIDNCVNIEDEGATLNDVEDLERLNMFLSKEHHESEDIDGDDWQDLQKLDTLLTNENKYSSDHSNKSPLFG